MSHRIKILLIPALLLSACTSGPATTTKGNLDQLTLPGSRPSASPKVTILPGPSSSPGSSPGASPTNTSSVKVRNLLVWEVKPAGQAGPVSYLIGTLSGPLASDFPIPALISDKLKAAKAYYSEANLNLSTEEAKANTQYVKDDKQNLENMLGAESWQKLQQWLEDGGLVIPDQVLRLFKPWFISQALGSTVRDRVLGKFSETSSQEGNLQAQAKQAGIALKYLETVADEFKSEDSVTVAEQLRLLKLELADGPDKLAAELTAVFGSYNRGDLAALEKSEAEARAESEEYYEKNVRQRHQRWVETLKTVLAQEADVVALGAPHLVGSEGLITRLQAQGFEIKRFSF
ncbi:MAG: TraB/GumN family protein [Candidatus Sericytochromatia bacterium]